MGWMTSVVSAVASHHFDESRIHLNEDNSLEQKVIQIIQSDTERTWTSFGSLSFTTVGRGAHPTLMALNAIMWLGVHLGSKLEALIISAYCKGKIVYQTISYASDIGAPHDSALQSRASKSIVIKSKK